MQLLGVLLILINVGAIVGPIAGVVIVYRNNLQDLVVPPEVEQMVTNTMNTLTSSNPDNSNSGQSNAGNTEGALALPMYVSSTYDAVAKTITAVFNFTNTFSNFTIVINSVAADVQCHAHSFMLGHAAMANPVEVPPLQTVDLTVVFSWTDAAQQHFETAHTTESSINVDFVNIAVNVSGISIQTPETYNVDIPLSQ